ncbi:MAG: hypothetical protein JXQ90_13415 [Cyclobacteriaceae bacterium]
MKQGLPDELNYMIHFRHDLATGNLTWFFVSIDKLVTPNNQSISIFPNPSENGFITLSIKRPEIETKKISLFDTQGHAIWRTPFESPAFIKSHQVDVSGLKVSTI